MRSGICPKCNSREVYYNANLRYKSGSYNSNTIPLSFFRSIALDNYVCTHCGYMESYIADPTSLDRIKGVWERVDPK